MQKLNLPEYSFKVNRDGQISQIFDAIRKKYVVLTPEEWVRQHIIRYFTEDLGYPSSRVAVEMSLKYNGMSKRCDVVIFGKSGSPDIIIECKSPSVKISQETFEQIARYNMTLRVQYLVVTNGLNNYCCEINFEEQSYRFMENIPPYSEKI